MGAGWPGTDGMTSLSTNDRCGTSVAVLCYIHASGGDLPVVALVPLLSEGLTQMHGRRHLMVRRGKCWKLVKTEVERNDF